MINLLFFPLFRGIVPYLRSSDNHQISAPSHGILLKFYTCTCIPRSVMSCYICISNRFRTIPYLVIRILSWGQSLCTVYSFAISASARESSLLLLRPPFSKAHTDAHEGPGIRRSDVSNHDRHGLLASMSIITQNGQEKKKGLQAITSSVPSLSVPKTLQLVACSL